MTPSSEFTDWTLSPRGFVESGWGEADISLSALPPATAASLRSLAEGRGEPVGITIREICDFLVSADRAEGTVLEAVEFYVSNYVYA